MTLKCDALKVAVHSALTLSALLGVEKINDSASNIVHLHVTMDCIKFSRQKNNYQKPWAPTKNDQIPWDPALVDST